MLAGSLFQSLPPANGEDEQFLDLLTRPGLRIERIVSNGQASPEGFWYDQAWGEWVMVLKGAAGIQIEGEVAVRELGPGGWIELEAHCRHRVAWTAPDRQTIWLAVHYEEICEAGKNAPV